MVTAEHCTEIISVIHFSLISMPEFLFPTISYMKVEDKNSVHLEHFVFHLSHGKEDFYSVFIFKHNSLLIYSKVM